MTRKLLILVITALVLSSINGQTASEDNDFVNNDAEEKSPETNEAASEQSEAAANDGSKQETPSEKDPNQAEVPPSTESSTAQEASTQSGLRTTVFDGSDQVYVLVPAPNPFPNLGSSAPFYMRPHPPPQYHPQPTHLQNPPQPMPFPFQHPPMMPPFMPMPHPMMFPPPMPPPMMIKPGQAPPPNGQPIYAPPNQPGSPVILFNQQKNPGDSVMGQSTIYLKPDGNREIIIIK